MHDDGWQPIDTAPRDGTEFVGWTAKDGLALEHGEVESRCRIEEKTGEHQFWTRLDYDCEGFDGLPPGWSITH